MKRILMVSILILIAAGSAFGAACEVITVAGTAIGPTAATITPTSRAGYDAAFCYIETASVRFRTDGTNPTASVGLVATQGQAIEIDNREEMLGFKMIRTGETSATATCCYW